jgi:glycosyltransferase involved in cell wall biosynthesis
MRSPLDVRSLLQIKSWCKARKVDLIDAHTGKAHGITSSLRWFGINHPVVVHRRIPDPPAKNWFTKQKYIGPSVQKFVPISRAIATSLTQYGVDETRIELVYSAVDERPYQGLNKDECRVSVRRELGLADDAILVCSMARLAPDKGHVCLVSAAAQIVRRLPNATFVLAGEGDERAHIEKRMSELALGHRFRLLGFRKDVSRLMMAADLFVHPSLEEGLGTIVLEAGLACVPIIASRVGGIPEFVEDQRGGILTTAGDPALLAEAIATMLQNPQRAREMASHNALLASTRHHRQTMVKGNVSVYSSLLHRP